VAPAVVHAPFGPVGYVLVDGHLLLPATWDDPVRPAPATGGTVAVNVPCGKLQPNLLPLAAFAPEPATAPKAEPHQGADPPIETASPPAMDPGETPADKEAPKALEEG